MPINDPDCAHLRVSLNENIKGAAKPDAAATVKYPLKPIQRSQHFGDSSETAARLEEIFLEHGREAPPELLRETAGLKTDFMGETSERMRVIQQAMRMVDKGRIDREETLFALDLVIEYLESAMEDCQALPHMYDLRDALVELDTGIVDPLLRPNKPSNRVPDRFSTRLCKVQAAACCQALIELKVPRESAARRIARILKSNCREKLSPPSATAVLYWRKTFRRELSFEVYRGYFRAIAWCGNGFRYSAVDKHRALVALCELIGNPSRFPNRIDRAFFVHDGKLYQRWPGHGRETNFSTDDRDRVQSLVQIRDIVSDLFVSRLNCNRRTSAILSRELVTAYNGFARRWGPINKTETTGKRWLTKTGEMVIGLRMPNFDMFREDPDWAMVAAIEQYDAKAGKAALDPCLISST